jgi:probable rRNA maturation factor
LKEERIFFFNEDTTYQLRQRKDIRYWLSKVARKEKHSIIELNYIFCSDEHLLQINNDYLKHDYYTDIITFDNSEKKGSIEGDIFISIDRVRENAASQKSSIKDELHRVMVHGLLHLTGYKDKTAAEKETMRKKEDSSLSLRAF